MTGWFILLGLWAAAGIPYGIKRYRSQRKQGVEKRPAIIKAVLHGICSPVEIVFKGIVGAIKEVFKD